MKTVTIPIDIPSDILITLNESEQELKSHFMITIAISLFMEKKLTLGKAVRLSGLSRYEFEKSLAKHKIPISDIDEEQIFSDVEKLSHL